MKSQDFRLFVLFFIAVLFSCSSVMAQDAAKTKETAAPIKEAKTEAVSTTRVVVTDNLKNTIEANKGGAIVTSEKPSSMTKTFGTNTVSVTGDVAGQSYENGKWFMVTKWDGSKWVSKREWFPNKKP